MSISSLADTSVIIELSNISPVHGGTDIHAVIECWEDLLRTIAVSPPIVAPRKTEPDTYIVEAATANFIDYLKSEARLGDYRAIEGYRDICPRALPAVITAVSDFLKSVAPSSNRLTLHLRKTSGEIAPERYLYAVGKFLQHLFLGMNLAQPGSLNLFSCRYPEHPNAFPLPPNLSGDMLELALKHTLERDWPPLQSLPFKQVWNWLTGELPYSLDLAVTAHHRALFTILRICSAQTNESDTILLIAQALEAFFSGGKEAIGSTVKQRLELVLGEPKTHKNWFNKFYELRSRIAHGTLAILRPGELADDSDPVTTQYIEDFYSPIDEAIAVLLALLQDLIQWNAREYHFPQRMVRVCRQDIQPNS